MKSCRRAFVLQAQLSPLTASAAAYPNYIYNKRPEHLIYVAPHNTYSPQPQRINNTTTSSKMSEPRIAFLGAGQMATALARGFIDANVTRPENIIASDHYEPQLPRFQKDTGGATKTTKSNVEAVQNSDVVILSVKPQVMSALLQEIKEAVSASPHLVISIAAGITMETILNKLGSDTRLVRVMPNTPCLVGKTAAAYSLGGKATPEDGKLVAHLLSSVGLGTEVPERLLDAVTGVSGSGPAYVYQFIEALSDGGVAAGLPRDVASKLAAQTVLGAAQMVVQTGEHPGVLKDKVASPGGTTIAGLHALEKGGLRATVMDAVLAATERSKELAKSE